MPTPTIIETDLREVLGEINNKLETVSKDVNQIQVKLATIDTKVDGLEKRLDNMDKRFDKVEQQIEKVESNQSRQVWALIGFFLQQLLLPPFALF